MTARYVLLALSAVAALAQQPRTLTLEEAKMVAALMPELCALLTDGLIEAHDTIIYKSTASKGLPTS